MNNHQLPSLHTGLHHESYDLPELLLAQRFVQALTDGASRYPVHRELRFAARIELEALFDKLALTGPWSAQRIDATNMILDAAGADGVFVSASGSRKQDYCSCFFNIWASTPEAAEAVKARILAITGEARVTEPMFVIDWHFLNTRGSLHNVSIEERANETLHDLAYPEIEGGIEAFIAAFLDADETVLVLQGPPGTGKTRLVRAIMGAMSRRKGEDARALYTGDKKAIESDEIFVRFITGWEDAFIIEDADHLLKPRCDGNEHLHRFLSIADGVVRAQGRKIIFSTNLPNVGDLDDAMIRPGRCFARVMVRELRKEEAEALVAALVTDVDQCRRVIENLLATHSKSYSLAKVYGAIKAAMTDGV